MPDFPKPRSRTPRSSKPYRVYLEKEMTIMGLLSTFCLAALAFEVGKVPLLETKEAPAFLDAQSGYVLCSVVCLLLGALAFYRQRSLLAFYFGQLALDACAPNRGLTQPRHDLLEEANSWETWITYRWGFFFACTGIAAYGFARFAHWQCMGWRFALFFGFLVGYGIALMLRLSYFLRRNSDKANPVPSFPYLVGLKRYRSWAGRLRKRLREWNVCY
jgi:hypothetical protein